MLVLDLCEDGRNPIRLPATAVSRGDDGALALTIAAIG
jgi:hypothetical protein